MNSENAKYWIWFTQAIGYTTPKAKKLTELYSDISVFYNGGEREWRLSGIFTGREIDKLSGAKLSIAEKIINRCNTLGYDIITIEDEDYPECLYNIYDPPAVLYVSGKLPDMDSRFSIGIVGTRRASKYGRDNSYRFGYALAKYGTVVVSGGALGVDCASHRGALAASGVTVCVRGCGINSKYLKDNANMRKAIANRGAVISEYPPDEEPKPFYFPARNRIIAALSDGVLIIESGVRSGSLITANLAIEMGKEVFALLGNNNSQNEGSNQRIKEGTAIPVTDFMDILTSFNNLELTAEDVDFDSISMADIDAIPYKGMPRTSQSAPAAKSENRQKNKKTEKTIDKRADKTYIPPVNKEPKMNISLRGDSKIVYEYLTNEPVHIDKISEDLAMPVYRVLSTLTFLEMNGLVQPLQGRHYVLI